MITRTNNMQSNNTFGVRLKVTKETKIDPQMLAKTPEYVSELLDAAILHNNTVKQDKHANKATATLLSLSLRDTFHPTSLATQGEIKVKIGNETLSDNFSTTEAATETIKKLSDYVDKRTGHNFEPGIKAKMNQLSKETDKKPLFARIWNAITNKD